MSIQYVLLSDISQNELVFSHSNNTIISIDEIFMIQAYKGQVNLFMLFEMFACTKELTVSSVITEELIISINEDNDDQNILPVCDNGGITKLVASHSYLTSMFAIYKNRIQTLRHL
ncbi:hypothetical protein GJ496_008206 [Pomphorhynchus laevis]|nr:hypothetical protein GJ496_008206 [Pomphorhynchus laevis]